MTIVHVITRLILGGAQENTLLTVDGLHHHYRDDVVLITGPAEGPEGDLFARAKSRGLNVRLMPELVRAVRPATDLRAYRALRKAMREIKPDVVHTHSSKAGIVGRAAAWNARVPAVVHTIHGLPFGPSESAINNRVYVAAERWAARRCHAMISVCHAMTEQALAAGVGRPEQYTTIYSGMDVDSFLNAGTRRAELRAAMRLESYHVAFATVARLFERKGHDDLLQVAPRILDANPNVRFVWIGSGVLRDRLQAEAERLGVAHAIHFTGIVPPDQIPELLAACDAVIHPSLREGLARVLPQSLLVERPAISYDIDGAREVIIDDVTGYLLKPRDLDGLRNAMLRLAADADLRARLGQEGRRRCAQPFRQEVMVDQIRAVYEKLLGKNPLRREPA